MIESIILYAILAVCVFFTGRRFYRQWRSAIRKDGNISCGDSCSCCVSSSCDSHASQKGK
ncbi:MAG: FeoB-associated Cys-rich membrane protein [Desulforhopalus sp.]